MLFLPLISWQLITYNYPPSLQRKNGLFKKAYELGVLCSVDVAVIIFGEFSPPLSAVRLLTQPSPSEERAGHHLKLYQYCSGDIHDIIQRHVRVSNSSFIVYFLTLLPSSMTERRTPEPPMISRTTPMPNLTMTPTLTMTTSMMMTTQILPPRVETGSVTSPS